jgi:hypothetical protein
VNSQFKTTVDLLGEISFQECGSSFPTVSICTAPHLNQKLVLTVFGKTTGALHGQKNIDLMCLDTDEKAGLGRKSFRSYYSEDPTN